MALNYRVCSEKSCNARAWHDDLCNLHALERQRAKVALPRASTVLSPAARLKRGRDMLRKRARELGIVVEKSGQDGASYDASSYAKVTPRKTRSPMG